MCGGTPRPTCPSCPFPGLSPRVRGNPPSARAGGSHPGSIPACAGEPSVARLCTRKAWVYPRVCGGTDAIGHVLAAPSGLSPRVRGNLRHEHGRQQSYRSIPACAGEPTRTPSRRLCPRVYPRVCGGTRYYRRVVALKQGLSPRVRGNLGRVAVRLRVPGSIPACAGEPGVRVSDRWPARVYPRVCGGTWVCGDSRALNPGLSPRVRGNQHLRQRLRLRERSIPACAGEPFFAQPFQSLARVYPRVCGGTDPFRPGHLPRPGLSPRVRGNRAL